MDEKRIVIDLRRKPEEQVYKEMDADLIIEIDLFDRGYAVGYKAATALLGQEPGAYVLYGTDDGVDRAAMVRRHVEFIRELKPKSVVIRTGKHSTGHLRDIPLHPGVIKLIIEGKLDASKLTLPG